jgi:hypothetical protein
MELPRQTSVIPIVIDSSVLSSKTKHLECPAIRRHLRARGFAVAQAKTLEVNIDDGFLDIEFMHKSEAPKISAIEIVGFD